MTSKKSRRPRWGCAGRAMGAGGQRPAGSLTPGRKKARNALAGRGNLLHDPAGRATARRTVSHSFRSRLLVQHAHLPTPPACLLTRRRPVLGRSARCAGSEAGTDPETGSGPGAVWSAAARTAAATDGPAGEARNTRSGAGCRGAAETRGAGPAPEGRL